MMRRPCAGVLTATLTGVLCGIVGAANPAAAHVTIDPSEATQGGYATVVFRMPNDRDDAATTKLDVVMPREHPIPSVRTMDVPGWTVDVTTRRLDKPIETSDRRIDRVVDRITWTARRGQALTTSEFVQFPVSMGALPKTEKLVFKALQTYDDGDVVRWIEKPQEGQEEPEHPAPLLTLARAPAEGATGTDPAGVATSDTRSTGGTSGTPLWLGILSLVTGLGGLALGALAYGRSRTAGGTSAAASDEA